MTVPAIDQARSMPWFMETRLHGERVADVLERTPRFRFEGDGLLSTRRIVPETQAARDALAGASGPRVEQALRGLLGTFDAQSGVTNLEAIGFSVDGASAAVNHALGNLSWPGISELDAFAPVPRPDANGRERFRVRGALEALATQLDEAHRSGANWGVSYRSINVAQATTDAFFGALQAGDRGASEERLDETTHLLVHELAHRVTEPRIDTAPEGDPNVDPALAAHWSRMQLLSEGSADLITHLPGMKHDARARMGLAAAEEQEFPSGYEQFVATLDTVLRRAGVDSSDRANRALVVELLERPELEDVPASLATLVVQHNGIAWNRHHEVARAIAGIGEHGIMAVDGDSFDAARAALRERTAAFEALVDRMAAEAPARPEPSAGPGLTSPG